MSVGLTYDTGALIAAERDSRLMWALHRAALTRGVVPIVAAGALAESWRGGPQARLCMLLKGCDVEPLTEAQAREVGLLAAACGLDDTVDLAVVEGALRRDDAVVSSNRSDLELAASAVGRSLVAHDI